MRRGATFWVGAAAGWSLIGWGLRGALHHSIDTRPGQLARFLVGGALAHDLLLAPLVLLSGVALARAVPGRWRAAVQAALIVSGPLVLFTYPEIRAYGRALRNPTSLPHNYTTNLAVVIAAVCAVALAGALLGRRRSSRRTGVERR